MSLTRHEVVLWVEGLAQLHRADESIYADRAEKARDIDVIAAMRRKQSERRLEADYFEFVVRALRDPEPDTLAHGLAAKLREISEVLADAGVTGGTLRQGVIELRERAERAEAGIAEVDRMLRSRDALEGLSRLDSIRLLLTIATRLDPRADLAKELRTTRGTQP